MGAKKCAATDQSRRATSRNDEMIIQSAGFETQIMPDFGYAKAVRARRIERGMTAFGLTFFISFAALVIVEIVRVLL